MRASASIGCTCLFGLIAATAPGQCRLFFQVIGDDPAVLNPGSPVVINANPGDELILAVFLEDCPVPVKIVGVRAPCSTTCTDIDGSCTCAGAVDQQIDPDPAPSICIGAGPNEGQACLDNNDCKVCVGGPNDGGGCAPGNVCPGGLCAVTSFCSDHAGPLIDYDVPSFLYNNLIGIKFPALGDCGGAEPLPLVLLAPPGGFPGPFPVVTTPRYIGQFKYVVGPSARGAFTINIPNEPQSTVRDGMNVPIPFTTDGAIIQVICAQCCAGNGTCVGDLTRDECKSLGHIWYANSSCFDPNPTPCGCLTNSACNDGNPCTLDVCMIDGANSTCVSTFQPPPGFCCDPAGGFAIINDNNECTQDTCNPANGQVAHAPITGSSCASDGDPCTIDLCVAGDCAHTPDTTDTDGDGIPDCQDFPEAPIPTVSTWGFIALGLLLLVAARVAFVGMTPVTSRK